MGMGIQGNVPLISQSRVHQLHIFIGEENSDTLLEALLRYSHNCFRYQELAKNYNVENIVGGATHNSIKVAQWMLQVPGATSYMGGIGKDKFGEEMKKNSKLAGVNVGLIL
ncbi:Adenosine kinase 2 [Glycine max]|nr:Adenosine kinase 2 [Glycine max]